MICYTRPNHSSLMEPYTQRRVVKTHVERELESRGGSESGGGFKGGVV